MSALSNGINQKIAKLLIKKQCSCSLPYTFFYRLRMLTFFSKSTILESAFRVPNISGSKLHVCKDFFSKSRVSNGLGQDQARHFVGPDLDAICLQRLSAENILRKTIEGYLIQSHL